MGHWALKFNQPGGLPRGPFGLRNSIELALGGRRNFRKWHFLQKGGDLQVADRSIGYRNTIRGPSEYVEPNSAAI